MTPSGAGLAGAMSGSRGGVVILSENPIHDSGGGQRSAQLAGELLRRGFCVLFVSRGRVTETTNLGLRHDDARLVRRSLADFLAPEGRRELDALLDSGLDVTLLTQVAVKEWLPVLERVRAAGAVTVYDCMDRWDSELGRGWYARDAERSVAEWSDVLLATAPALARHVEGLVEREAALVPNACDGLLFRRDAAWERPADLPAGGRVALFVGALWGGWLDWRLVRAAAEACPDTRFAFVGDHRREGRGLPGNCSFLGLKAHGDLPPYLAHADLAILPWRVDEVTHAMSPLTVYEHVAMGLPVVAAPIEPLADVPGVVCAEGLAFIEAVRATDRAGLEDDVRRAMADFAARSTWSERVDAILERVEQARWRGAPGARATGPIVKSRERLSVVIPSYNHARFVGEAVDSVRSQTLAAPELLVVDDGSSDSSLDVLSDHAFPGMRCIAQANCGAHATINRAIALSEGDYVAILNSDDAFSPERLERAWGVASGSGAALVVGSVRLVDGEGDPLPADHEVSRWYAEARALARAVPPAEAARRENFAVTTSNLFLHRELWRRLGGFAAYRYVHDYDFLLRALELCPDRVVYVDELCDVRYRVHGGNTISENVERALAERADMLRSLRGASHRVRARLARPREGGAVARAVDGTPLPRPVAGGAAGTPRVRAGIVARSLDAGGLEEVVALLAQALPSEGVGTSVLCTHGGGALADRLREAGVPVTVAEGDEDAWRRWRAALAPGVLCTHSSDPRALEVLAEDGTPVVETVHNTYVWLSADEWAAEAGKREAVSATIAVSETVARYHARHCPGPGPMHVVPNAVHPARTPRVPRAWARRHLGVSESEPLFVHHGRAAYQKNLPGLLGAFADLLEVSPAARLWLVGPPESEEAFAELKEAHRTLFERGAVRHVPRVATVGTVLSAADAYVSASFFEGWSVAASEALWVGRPVVLTECGGAAELVGADGARGRLVPNAVGDPVAATRALVLDPPADTSRRSRHALTEAMHTIVEERPAWSARSPAIRAHARVALSPGRMAADHARILLEVAGASGGR